MHTFRSNDLFGAFLVFVALFVIIVLLDLFYKQCKSSNVEVPIYGKHHTFGFYAKRMLARLVLTMGKRKPMPDDLVDKLQTFSDTDEMVNNL